MITEKRNNLRVVSSGFISLNLLKTDFSFQGVSNVLMRNFFPTAEGYVKVTAMADSKFGKQAFSFKSKKSVQFGGDRAAGEMWSQLKDPFIQLILIHGK